MIPRRESEVGHFVFVGIQCSGGNFVQQRFPQMRMLPIYQMNFCLAGVAVLASKACCQFEAAGATADNDDFVGFLS